jgi:hypothetical protein
MNIPFSREKMAPNKINFSEKFSKLPEDDYSVRIVTKMNNYGFKIVKFKGEFVWHSTGEATSWGLPYAGRRHDCASTTTDSSEKTENQSLSVKKLEIHQEPPRAGEAAWLADL